MKRIGKILLVIGIVGMAIFSFMETQKCSQNEDQQRIIETVSKLSLKCYSIEGRYPQDIQYLKDYYGLLLNENDYQIIYHYEGDNLAPTIRVYAKEKTHE